MLNVNFPPSPDGEIAGAAFTRLGRRDRFGFRITQQADPWGEPLFWIGVGANPHHEVEGSEPRGRRLG